MKKLISLAVVLFAVAIFSPAMAQKGKVATLNYPQFESLLDDSDNQDRNLVGETPIIIDFSATWCGPCQKFAPIYDKAALKYAGKVNFYKVDIDQERELTELFGIEVVPTVIVIPVKGDPMIYAGQLQTAADIDEALNIILKNK